MKLGELMQVLIEMGADLSWDVVIAFSNSNSGSVDSADAFDGKLYLSCEGDASIDESDNPAVGEQAETERRGGVSVVQRFFAANTMQSNSGQFVRVEEYEKLMAVVKQFESDNRKLRQTVTELAIQLHEAKKHNSKPKQIGREE